MEAEEAGGEKAKIYWSTESEIKFLTHLKKKNPVAFEQYKKNFYRRTNWDNIDVRRVAKFIGLVKKPKKK